MDVGDTVDARQGAGDRWQIDTLGGGLDQDSHRVTAELFVARPTTTCTTRNPVTSANDHHSLPA